jgi:tetratricopeptide (TPR) repeat protein
MAKIPLRAYHREIESLIDQGQQDEALAHCDHILRSYPKCLDTYRLMGKALLEAQRFQDAEDIFRRLLQAVPDDFVGNLGMSIIQDERKNLNDAIWHMERAFEVQPSNTAVQGELRRLYGRRDGLEPPQIRLTRGALAQMYARGSQIQQAIAEIRSILADDPERMDMRVLLARAYLRGGLRADASDTCTALLKNYPYCLDANRIMVEVAGDGARSDSTQIYRHRVDALEPYSQFVPGSLFAVADVPDNAIMIEKTEYDALGQMGRPGPGDGTLAQTALALSLGAESESMSSGSPLPPAEEVAAPAEEIPDWLKAAGWGAATAEAVRRSDMQAQEEALSPTAEEGVADELAAAEVPDWLKAMAPPEAAGAAGKVEDLETAEADMDWLAGLEAPAEAATSPEAEATHVGPGITAAAVAAAAAAAAAAHNDEEETPEEQVQPEPASDLPDWMRETALPASAEGPSGPSGPLPDWMQESPAQEASPGIGLGAVAAGMAMAAASDGKESPVDGEPSMESQPGEQPSPEEAPQDVATWLASLDEGETAAAGPAPGAEPAAEAQMTEDETFAWLESLAAKQGANPEELLTTPEERTEAAPAWLGEPEPETPAGGMMAAAVLGAAAGAALSKDEQPEEGPPVPSGEEVETPPAAEPALEEPPVAEPEEPAGDLVGAAVAGAAAEASLSKEEQPGEIPPTPLGEEVETPPASEPAVEVPPLAEPEELAGERMDAAVAAAALGAALSHEAEPEEAAPGEGLEAAEGVPMAAAGAGEPPAGEAAGEDLSWLEGFEQEQAAHEAEAGIPPVSEWVPAERGAPAPEEPMTLEPESAAAGEPGAEEMPDWLRSQFGETTEPAEPEVPLGWMAAAAVHQMGSEDETATGQEEAAFAAEEASEAEEEAAIEIAHQLPPEGDRATYEQAQIDLQRGNLAEATAGYARLIKRGKMLDEVISDLREGTYRYPMDVVIWMTLGDAYKRANRLQEALDAYTKGEELLR